MRMEGSRRKREQLLPTRFEDITQKLKHSLPKKNYLKVLLLLSVSVLQMHLESEPLDVNLSSRWMFIHFFRRCLSPPFIYITYMITYDDKSHYKLNNKRPLKGFLVFGIIGGTAAENNSNPA